MLGLLNCRVIFLGLLFVPLTNSASDDLAPVTLKQDVPASYTVVKGDTLWDISALYLENAWQWPRLWQANPDIDNPHLIHPGDRLYLTWRDGQPTLSLKPMVKLSPSVRLVDKRPIPTLKPELVLSYLEPDRLLSQASIESSARVLGASHGRQFLTEQDAVYVSGLQPQSSWGIYRQMASFTRKDKVVVALKRIASAEQVEYGEHMTRLHVTEQRQEIMPNDIALPEQSELLARATNRFYPTPAPTNHGVQILGSLTGQRYVGQYDVVVLNRGLIDELVQGNMFELYQPGAQVTLDNGQLASLANTHIGNLIVIRPYQHFSLALVSESTQPIGVDSKLIAPPQLSGVEQ
ncbi:LysM peptidoglycan-binding domain-containing protein [Vibrio ouci]|uniref:LysM peptidoglycan-binding domain-containing protein n=1 Tax=Vibrio ouci TaxID=2499078 RepID=UPI001FC97FF2|nr:LysM peptidoglycan-binding domain-containing protein [Vibrio ouci]